MSNIGALHLKILQQGLGGIAYELTQVRFCARGSQPPWRPAINLYRCQAALVICVDLAGIDRSDIDLRVESQRVRVAGRREPPAPEQMHGQLLQIQALEIDDGRFEREILLPEVVLPDETHAEQRNGLLWISLPLR